MRETGSRGDAAFFSPGIPFLRGGVFRSSILFLQIELTVPACLFQALFAIACAGATLQPAAAQNRAKILADSRYLSNNGQFGAAYSQDDGVDFKEETDADGNRRGSYSYVDPGGHKRTVSYTAGKDGFKAFGDHLPTAPDAAPVAPTAPSQWPHQW